MDSTLLKYQLLAELLPLLEAEGMVVGVGQQLQLQELLNKLPEDIPAERLRSYLCPAIATSEAEQQRFNGLFAQALAQAEAMQQEPEPVDTAEEKEPATKEKWIRWAIVLLSLLIGGALLYMIWPEQKDEGADREAPYRRQIDTYKKRLTPDSTVIFDLSRSSVPVADAYLLDGTPYSGESPLGSYRFIAPGRLEYRAKDTVGEESILVAAIDYLGFRDSIRCTVRIFRPTPPPANEPEEVWQPPFSKEIQDTIPSSLATIVPTPLRPVDAFISRHLWWLRWAFIALSGLLLALILYQRERRRRKLIAEREHREKPPYHWDIELPEAPIMLPEAFERRLSQLRRRTGGAHYRLDLPATIDATVAKAGMVDFRYRRQTQPPEYLFLIDRQVDNNHRACLFDRLYQYLRQKEVLVERFFFDSDLRHCYNDEFPDGLRLPELQYRYPNARLVILGLGYQLLSPRGGRLAPWASVFKGWKQRALMSTKPTSQWGRHERLLQEQFLLAPASLQGLNHLSRRFEDPEESAAVDWSKELAGSGDVPVEFFGGLIPSLRQYYSRSMLHWIAACAVYPSLHWPLTLHLGQLLSAEKEPLLTFDKLNALTRLPWFVGGQIPKPAREVLLAYLEAEEPALLLRVRREINTALRQEQNIPPKDSAAWDDYRMNLFLNEWLATKDKKRKKELGKKIDGLWEKGVEADFTIVKYLERERTPLDFIVPESWKKHLRAGGLKWKKLRRDLLWAIPLLVALIFLAFQYSPSTLCSGEPLDYEFTTFPNEPAGPYCLEDARDSLLANQFLAREAVRRQEWEREDSLTGVSRRLYAAAINSSDAVEVAWDAYRRNLAAEYYLAGVPLGNRADSLRYLSDRRFPRWRDSACFHFERAWQLDSTWAELAWPRDWCSGAQLYTISGVVADSATGRPLSGVRVTYLDRNSATDGRGRYRLQLPPSLDSVQVQFSMLLYDTLDYTFTLRSDRPSLEKVSLAPQPAENPEDLDNDGIINTEDLCPRMPGSSQNKGCPAYFTDPRDGQEYPIVVIGEQAWMGRNLNYAMSDSWCYLELPALCDEAGRLYTWNAARQACPPGWRLPTIGELDILVDSFGDEAAAYQALIEGGESGFAARLGGSRVRNGEFFNLGRFGGYWSSTENDADDAWIYGFNGDDERVGRIYDFKSYALSCRCLKDN